MKRFDDRMTPFSEDTFEQCLGRIRSAWDAGDAPAYAREFADDATYIIFRGEALIGRDAIERSHATVFHRWQRGTKMAVRPVEVRSLAENVVSVVTVGGVGKGKVIPFDKLQTFTFVKRGDRWLCAAFHNTRMNRASKRGFQVGSRSGSLGAMLGWLRSQGR